MGWDFPQQGKHTEGPHDPPTGWRRSHGGGRHQTSGTEDGTTQQGKEAAGTGHSAIDSSATARPGISKRVVSQLGSEMKEADDGYQLEETHMLRDRPTVQGP